MSPRAPLRVALIAGEDSGDALGAGLITALKHAEPDIAVAGVAGPRMRAAGIDAWRDAGELSVMGLAEVLRHLPRLLALKHDVLVRVRAWRPDVLVGIDAPDFNLGVERAAKRRGIATIHYVSPSVWAWRPERAQKLGRSADRVLCLFPMEPPIYARHGVDARFVGHPLADRYPSAPDRARARAELGIDPEASLLALLPGSRLGEIARLGPVFVEAAARLRAALPGLRVIAPMANARCRAAFVAFADAGIDVIDGRVDVALAAADAALLASGTVALEALLAKCPMVVGYRLSPLTALALRTFKLLQTDVYSLPNILAGRELVPELIQERCTAERLADALAPLLTEPSRRAALLPEFTRLHASLRGSGDAGAAAAVLELARRARGVTAGLGA